MKIVPTEAIAVMTGVMGEYYIRQLHGKLIMQRRPTKFSQRQIEVRKEFGRKYNGKNGKMQKCI